MQVHVMQNKQEITKCTVYGIHISARESKKLTVIPNLTFCMMAWLSGSNAMCHALIHCWPLKMINL